MEEVTHQLLFVWEQSPDPFRLQLYASNTDTGAGVTAGLVSMLFMLAPLVTRAGTKADALQALSRTLARKEVRRKSEGKVAAKGKDPPSSGHFLLSFLSPVMVSF